MPYIYCFDGRLWSNLLPAHGQRDSKSRRTQKEKMETQLYSFTRFLCLCSRELTIALNYYAVCKKVCGKLGQSSSPEHSHSAPRRSTEGGFGDEHVTQYHVQPPNGPVNAQFFEVPVPEYNVDALNLDTKVAPVPFEYVFCSSSKAFLPQPTALHIHTSMLLLRFNMAPEVDQPWFVNVLKSTWFLY